MSKNNGKQKVNLFYKFVRFIAAIVVHLFFRIQVIGRENIPDTGGFISSGNHRSLWDVVVLAVAMKNRQLRFLAKEELFKFKPIGYLFEKVGAYPVNRGHGDFAALDASADIIKSGQIVNIFPEGTRSLSGVPLKPKSGVGLVAFEARSDVLPFCIYLEGQYRFMKKITIRFGEIIKYDSFHVANTEKLSSKERKRISREIMDAIISLLEKGHEKA